MTISADLRKALLAGALITVASVVASVVPIWIWLQIDPVIDVASIYISAAVLPAVIAPSCSFFILRAQLRAERLARENHRLANRDALTDLPNRRAFFAEAEAMRAQAKASGGVLVCAIADIDNFKQVNDAFGHDAGDAVIKSVGGALQAGLPEGAIAARFGGEEFALAGVFASDRVARAHLAALVASVRQMESVHEDMGICVTISLGHAAAGEGDTLSGVLSRADRALYEAKHAGKDCALSAADLPCETRWTSAQGRRAVR